MVNTNNVILGLRMELARVGAVLKKGGKNTDGLKKLADLDRQLADRQRKIEEMHTRIAKIGKG